MALNENIVSSDLILNILGHAIEMKKLSMKPNTTYTYEHAISIT
jgi:hypothetical protein